MYKNVTTEKIRDSTPAIKHAEAFEVPESKTQFFQGLLLLRCHIPFNKAQFQHNSSNIKKLDTHFSLTLPSKET